MVICAMTGRSETLWTAHSAWWISSTSENVSRMNPSTPPATRPCACRRKCAERLEPHAERPDGAHDAGPAGARGARQLGRRPVDLLCLVGEPEAAELEGIGAERVGLEDLGAGADVCFVHFLDELGLFHAQLVVADVQEEALRIQHRAHRPVEDVDLAVFQEVAEGDCHPGVLANCLTWLQ